MSEPIHIISLGAGVQSSTMALMAARGEIKPRPVAAVFADTQDEPESVYDWLEYLKENLPFPIHIVTKGKLSVQALGKKLHPDGRSYSPTALPVFTKSKTGDIGKVYRRSCTRDYKITPILQRVRKIAKITRGQKSIGAIQWIGISYDEISRMKPAPDKYPWLENRHPLIDMKMTRDDCLDWMSKNGYEKPPRSACVYCPFHSNVEWQRLKTEEPKEWARALRFEKQLQKRTALTDTPYLHETCTSLAEVDFTALDREGWENECEGMCGV